MVMRTEVAVGVGRRRRPGPDRLAGARPRAGPSHASDPRGAGAAPRPAGKPHLRIGTAGATPPTCSPPARRSCAGASGSRLQNEVPAAMPLVPRRLSASRRFPHLSWAWPSGSRELLVIAAAMPTSAAPPRLFVEWLATTDIDSCAVSRAAAARADRQPLPRDAPQGGGAGAPQRHRAPAVDQVEAGARQCRAGAAGRCARPAWSCSCSRAWR